MDTAYIEIYNAFILRSTSHQFRVLACVSGSGASVFFRPQYIGGELINKLSAYSEKKLNFWSKKWAKQQKIANSMG